MSANYFSLRVQQASFGSLLLGTILCVMLVGASSTPVLEAAPRSAVVSPVPADGCDQYVTGDLVGDANPADVLASLCGSAG
jgi:hypothetical protein